MNRTVRIVAGREIRERIRARAFLISTGLTLVAMVAVVAVTSILSTQTKHFSVTTTGGASQLDESLRATAGILDVGLDFQPSRGGAADTAAVRSGDLDAVISGDAADPVITVNAQADPELTQIVTAAATATTLHQRFVDAGMTPQAADAAVAILPPTVISLQPTDRDAQVREGAAFIGDLLLYMSIVYAGISIAGAVVAEKSGRVVELLLAMTRPRDLLTGKLLGIGAVAVGQFVVFIVAGVVTALVLGTSRVPLGALSVAPHVVLWFVLGFGLYAVLFAAAGAAVNRFEDLQSATLPLTLLQVAGYLAGLSAISSPDSPLITAGSFFPFTAPMVMPVRVATGSAPWWQELLAAGLLLVVAWLCISVGSRVYRAGLLQASSSGWRQRLRAAMTRG